jgi:hypothetical protein
MVGRLGTMVGESGGRVVGSWTDEIGSNVGRLGSMVGGFVSKMLDRGTVWKDEKGRSENHGARWN